MSETTLGASDKDVDLAFELDLLEDKIQEAVRAIEALRAERSALEKECLRLRQERAETIARLSRMVEKVDALGVGL